MRQQLQAVRSEIDAFAEHHQLAGERRDQDLAPTGGGPVPSTLNAPTCRISTRLCVAPIRASAAGRDAHERQTPQALAQGVLPP